MVKRLDQREYILKTEVHAVQFQKIYFAKVRVFLEHMRHSVLSKLWSFLIIHQQKSKQNQLRKASATWVEAGFCPGHWAIGIFKLSFLQMILKFVKSIFSFQCWKMWLNSIMIWTRKTCFIAILMKHYSNHQKSPSSSSNAYCPQ